MRISTKTKWLLYATLLGLYLTGALTWLLQSAFLVMTEFGAQPSAYRQWLLEAHSVVGLFFLSFFGYLLHSHIRPGVRRKKHLVSGALLSFQLLALCLSVPFLFYLSSEQFKSAVQFLHAYVGLASLPTFSIHLWATLRTRIGPKKKREVILTASQ